MKILVCEDDEIALKVIQVALEGEPVQAVFVKDGHQALQQIRQTDFDIVVTDIHMPYHNGDEVLAVIREQQRKTIPLLMISSDTEEEVISLALKSGVTEFIKKPLDAGRLKKTLQKYIRG